MPARPNFLFLMTDQMQARVLEPGHPCATPCLDRLAARGVRITRAYTTNAVCSPARASLMTGLLPHSHGVTQVNHCVHEYEANLVTDRPHWAQRLRAAGYRTGYFGKWHVDKPNELHRYGWETDGSTPTPAYRQRAKELAGEAPRWLREGFLGGPEGFAAERFYGVTDRPAERRPMGVVCDLAAEYLAEVTAGDRPWCCFVSLQEPHDPFYTTAEQFDRYHRAFDRPDNWSDDLAGRPNLYRKSARVFAALDERQKREAAACYWGSITELDGQLGRLLDRLEAAGQADRTVVVLTSDHGELLGAHGLFQKNVGAYEEVYNIPMVVAGPGVAAGRVCAARVGLHELAPTLLELAGLSPVGAPDSRSFAPLAADPDRVGEFQQGYAEYYGTRHWYSQRIVWDGPWKLVWNSFDFDELYQLDEDPGELRNRIDDPACREVVRSMMALAYRRIAETGDHPLGDLRYASLRLAEFGPGITC